MKKRIFAVMLAAVMTASLMACGKTDDGKGTVSNKSTVYTKLAPEEYDATITANAEIYKTYFTMPEYKGIEVEMTTQKKEVTDQDIEDYIKGVLNSFAETEKVESGVTAEGDSIILDYSGTKDGVEFSGGTATDATHTIGSGGFIEDLEKGLVGLNVGQEYQIPCRFPDNYTTSDLAGKDVIFTVTVTAIQKKILPELTDEWVAENSAELGIKDITTVEGLRQRTKEMLEENAKTQYESAKYELVYKKIVDQISEPKYPQEEFEDLLGLLNDNVDSEFNAYSSMYGITDKEEFVVTMYGEYGVTNMDEFNQYADNYTKEYLLEKMIVTIIAAENDIHVTADDIRDTGEDLAVYYGYENYQSVIDEYGDEMNVDIGYQVLYQKVIEFLCEQAVEK